MSKILYVGMDHPMSDMTAKLLKRNGFDVDSVVGKKTALEEISTKDVSTVIVDLEESVDDRIDFCQKIKEFSKSIRILVISSDERDEEATLLGGADDWLKKPYNMKILCARIRAQLRL